MIRIIVRQLPWLLLFAVGGAASGLWVTRPAIFDPQAWGASASDATDGDQGEALAPALVGVAVRAAAARVDAARGRLSAEQLYERAFAEFENDGRVAEADDLLSIWDPDVETARFCVVLMRHRLARREWREARWIGWDCVERFPEQRTTLVQLWYASYAKDPDFLEPAVRLEPDVHVDRLTSMNRSSSVLFRYMRGGRTLGVFKPNQDVPHTNYRGEIATWRLCRLIHCDVHIPYNHEVRIAEHDLAALSGIEGVRESDAMIGSRGVAVWYRAPDGRRWLYGAYKEWVDDIIRLELERYEIWQPLLRAGRTAAELRRIPLLEALDGMPGLREMVRSGPNVSAFELSHQLSDMLVLDALVGNFDRFHDHWPGLNIHYADGTVVSLDNGASFLSDPDVAWDDPQARLEVAQLFSRRTYDAIRWMDTGMLFRILLPVSPLYDDDKLRWMLFRDRRAEVLGHINRQIKAEGADAVLIFP